jgi:hypothetical protein
MRGGKCILYCQDLAALLHKEQDHEGDALYTSAVAFAAQQMSGIVHNAVHDKVASSYFKVRALLPCEFDIELEKGLGMPGDFIAAAVWLKPFLAEVGAVMPERNCEGQLEFLAKSVVNYELRMSQWKQVFQEGKLKRIAKGVIHTIACKLDLAMAKRKHCFISEAELFMRSLTDQMLIAMEEEDLAKFSSTIKEGAIADASRVALFPLTSVASALKLYSLSQQFDSTIPLREALAKLRPNLMPTILSCDPKEFMSVDILSQTGIVLANLTLAQALWRDLREGESRSQLLTKAERGLKAKGYTPSANVANFLKTTQAKLVASVQGGGDEIKKEDGGSSESGSVLASAVDVPALPASKRLLAEQAGSSAKAPKLGSVAIAKAAAKKIAAKAPPPKKLRLA